MLKTLENACYHDIMIAAQSSYKDLNAYIITAQIACAHCDLKICAYDIMIATQSSYKDLNAYIITAQMVCAYCDLGVCAYDILTE